MGRQLLFQAINMPNFSEIYASGRNAPKINGVENIGISDNSVVNGVAGYTELFSVSIVQSGTSEGACLDAATTFYTNKNQDIDQDSLVFDNASGFSQTTDVYYKNTDKTPVYYSNAELDGNGYHILSYVTDCK